MINEYEHFFLCLPGIDISFLVQCPDLLPTFKVVGALSTLKSIFLIKAFGVVFRQMTVHNLSSFL